MSDGHQLGPEQALELGFACFACPCCERWQEGLRVLQSAVAIHNAEHALVDRPEPGCMVCESDAWAPRRG